MIFAWDEAKNTSNLIKHGIGFDAVNDFDWEAALIVPDRRYAYGEDRFIAYGMIGRRLHVVVFTLRHAVVRVIGLRKANERERIMYDEATET